MPHHHHPELAPQQLEKLGAGAVNFFLRGFILAASDGPAIGLDTGSFGITDDAVDIAGLYQAAQRRQFIKLVALRGELRGAGFNYFPDSI